MTLGSGADPIHVISSKAPLARAVLGKSKGDEVALQVGALKQQFEVLKVCRDVKLVGSSFGSGKCMVWVTLIDP